MTFRLGRRRARPRSKLCLLAIPLILALPGSASATVTQPDFSDSRIASLSSPTALASTPDGRILIGTQNGHVRLYHEGALRSRPALDLSASVCFSGEQGLLGVAVDPAFESNHFVYVYSTRRALDGSCVNRVSRFVLDGDVADLTTEVTLLDNIFVAPGGGHSGGDLKFGKDGFLYVSIGDGSCDYAGNSGCAGLNDASRDKHVVLGKILRITRDGDIPADNPFASTGGRCNTTGQTTQGLHCQETYAWGLRNPFRFAFDPNATGTRFFINDVGEIRWEEINEGQAGADYGWNVREGHCVRNSLTSCGPPPEGMTNPIFDYPHSTGCSSITGGAFVPASVWPEPYSGAYLYSDYVCGRIFRLVPQAGGGFTSSDFVTGLGASSAVAMAFAPHGSTQALYYTSYADGGEVRRIAYTGNRAPTASVTASPTSGAAPLEVGFDGGASSDPDAGDSLTYLWDFGDGSPEQETSGPTTAHVYGASSPQPPPRSYTATLRVRDARGGISDPAKVHVDVDNTPPVPTIESPDETLRFRVGQPISVEGGATDAEEGPLPDSSLTWQVVRVHNTHTHPFLSSRPGNDTGDDIQFTAPDPEDLAAAETSYLEIRLTATDSNGGTSTVTRAVRPNAVRLTFESDPPGADLEVDGIGVQAPQTFTSWEGYELPVEAAAQFGASGQVYEFGSWSDGGAAGHTITTPGGDATWTAAYRQRMSSYRAAVMGTPGLVSYWRLGESGGSVAADEKGANPGSYVGGVTLGQPGALIGDLDTGAAFDGENDEMTASGPGLALGDEGTLEGWFNLETRVMMRDSTSVGGWILGYGDNGSGMLAYRVGGTTYKTNQTIESVRGGWHHYALVKSGSSTAYYLDGVLIHSGSGAPSTPAAMPWRVMRSGTTGGFGRGQADELAVYDTALSAEQVAAHYSASRGEEVSGPPDPDDLPPGAPSGLSATAGNRSVTLDWADNTEQDLAGYDAYRATTAGGPYTKANSARLSDSAFTDTGLQNGTTYYYTVSASDSAGQEGPKAAEEVSATPTGPPQGAYETAVEDTAGLVSYWRLGEASGTVAADEMGANPGSYHGGVTLGRPGALIADDDTAAGFDGSNDEVRLEGTGLELGAEGTLEGWFWAESGVALRDSSAGAAGWILAYGNAGKLAYRVAGKSYTTTHALTDVRGGWHHYALVKSGPSTAYYLDGAPIHSGTGAPSTAALLPWRVMRSGTSSSFARGQADELAVYNTAVSADEIAAHYAAGIGEEVSGPPAPDGVPPAAPSGLSATAGHRSVTLDWADSGEQDLAGYDVYRATVAGGPYTKANSARLSDSGFTDTGLENGTTYYYAVTASDDAGQESPRSEEASATPEAPPLGPYPEAVMATPGLVSYWRLGESTGTVAADETGANPGSYVGGVTLGRPGALIADDDTAAGFDGSNDEVRLEGTGLELGAEGTLEGWFWAESGVPMRDSSAGAAGWILAYGNAGKLAYRVAGKSYTTTHALTDVRGGWHHYALVKSGPSTAYYLDGAPIHNGTGAPSTTALLPWRAMRSGTSSSFARGQADELAIYNTALTSDQVAAHYAAAGR